MLEPGAAPSLWATPNISALAGGGVAEAERAPELEGEDLAAPAGLPRK